MRVGIGLSAAMPEADMTMLGRWAAEAERAGFSSVGSSTENLGPASRAGRRGVQLAHNVRTPEDVGALLAAAEQAGGTIIRPAPADWGGTTGAFADPDGYVWRWPTTPAGPSTPTAQYASDLRRRASSPS